MSTIIHPAGQRHNQLLQRLAALPKHSERGLTKLKLILVQGQGLPLRTKELERENRELKRANEILRKAAAYFAQAELDRKPK